MSRAPRVALACALALFAAGLAILPLQTSAFTRSLSSQVSMADEAGLTQERMSEVAEMVRAFVVEGEGELPRHVDGGSGFEAEAVEHLVDVREVLFLARLATIVLGLMLAAGLGVTASRTGAAGVAAVLRLGAALAAVLPLAGLVIGAVSFDALFTAFHALLFASGTWIFPSDSLLIRAFPEAFWIACGIAWALLIALVAGCLQAAASLLEHGRARSRA